MKEFKVTLVRSTILRESDVEELFEHLINKGKYSLEFILEVLKSGKYRTEQYQDIYDLLEEDCYTNADEVNLKVENL